MSTKTRRAATRTHCCDRTLATWWPHRSSSPGTARQSAMGRLGVGYVNGKLAALRWVLGMEWDFLDT